MKPVLGCIADDFTGATDVASMLVGEGLRTVLSVGVPQGPSPHADAFVVALKSRTCPVEEAVSHSLAACDWLLSAGVRQIYFKYCSTFDSTARGNIGPVAEALADRLDARTVIACPAFPANGRTVYLGHLFVGEQLLSDSGMRYHPITPMTDPNLVRVLQTQVKGRVGLVHHGQVKSGPAAARRAIQALSSRGIRFAVADAIDDEDLRTLGEACADDPLVTAGSGVALGLPAAYVRRAWVELHTEAASLPQVGGLAAVLSGSCSVATNAQVTHWLNDNKPAFQIDARALARGQPVVEDALRFAGEHSHRSPVLLFATAEPWAVREVQDELGTERAGHLIEAAMGRLAASLVDRGVRRLVVAGGETSGAVVQALQVNQLRIGPTIDPGVPWTQALGRPSDAPLVLALKSGNFGTVDFFSKALARVA